MSSSEYTHRVEALWREADAAALEERVKAMRDWLDHTEDLVEMFKDDDSVATELRGVSGFIRTRRNDLTSEAQALWAKSHDRRNETASDQQVTSSPDRRKGDNAS